MSDEQSREFRHYLKIKEGADVPDELRLNCETEAYPSYSAARTAKRAKLKEYEIKDVSVIEIKFRR